LTCTGSGGSITKNATVNVNHQACVCGADYYRVNKGTTSSCLGAKNVCTSNCKKIINNSTEDIFVPTKTRIEWNSFIKYKPAGVSIINCF